VPPAVDPCDPPPPVVAPCVPPPPATCAFAAADACDPPPEGALGAGFFESSAAPAMLAAPSSPASTIAADPYFIAFGRNCMVIVSSFLFLARAPPRMRERITRHRRPPVLERHCKKSPPHWGIQMRESATREQNASLVSCLQGGDPQALKTYITLPGLSRTSNYTKHGISQLPIEANTTFTRMFRPHDCLFLNGR
jgi:hypothetical protein